MVFSGDFEDLPKQNYEIIYADPPWAYNESGTGSRVIGSKYPTMQIEDICRIPVKSIADDNCILFIWATFPRLPECLEAINAWGFAYKGLAFNWIKTNKHSKSLFMGMGYWTRQNAEVCLIGIKGKIQSRSTNTHSVIMSRRERHSKKPDRIRDLITKICGDRKRIELFARQASLGWDCWGNEVDAQAQYRMDFSEIGA